jgi:hypothetical protein
MKKKVLFSAEKSSVIWAEPHSRSSAKPNVRSVTKVHIADMYTITKLYLKTIVFCKSQMASILALKDMGTLINLWWGL